MKGKKICKNFQHQISQPVTVATYTNKLRKLSVKLVMCEALTMKGDASNSYKLRQLLPSTVHLSVFALSQSRLRQQQKINVKLTLHRLTYTKQSFTSCLFEEHALLVES